MLTNLKEQDKKAINHNQSEQSQDIQLKILIQQQVEHLRRQLEKSSGYRQNSYIDQSHKNPYRHLVEQVGERTTNDPYFDKQLTHLVVSQQFNFTKISQILSEAFKNNNIDTSLKACRQRWAYLHKNRHNILQLREKQKQDKRAISVAAFANPYSLYSVDQLIQNLQKNEKQQKNNKIKQKQNKDFNFEQSQKIQQKEEGTKFTQNASKGYNILKDSFRKIDNYEQYNLLQTKMKEALKKAQEQVYQQKPLYYTPKYQNLEAFQVTSQQLTPQKAKQLMTYQIQMEKISRELQFKKQEDQQRKYQSIIKKRIIQNQQNQHQKFVKKERSKLVATKNNQRGDLQQDWDEYQSD